MRRYWISWWCTELDYRPLTDPPVEGILGWWVSGTRCSDDAHSLVALVDAETEAKALLLLTDSWPEFGELRFSEARDLWFVPGDRFKMDDWMIRRLATAKEAQE